MIKICYIIGQLDKGGAERQLFELVKGINRKRFCPIVISLSHAGYWGRAIQKLNIQVIEIPRKRNREFTRLFKLIKVLNAIKPDIVQNYMFSANSYGRIAAILNRIPIIIASERNAGEIGKDKNKYKIHIDKLLSLFSDRIICNSFKASETLIKKYSFNAKKVLTVHNGVNLTDFLKEIYFDRRNKVASKVVGTVSSLCVQKNQRLFLDMAKIILNKSENKSIKFLIVGKGSLKNELEKYSKKLGIENYVILTGERDDIPKLLQSMDIFVMTSLYEGLSNAIMEAMLVGLPVVASDVGGNSELVVDGETGFLYQSNDAQALANRVIRLINNENEAKRMGEKGKNKILNEYGVEKMIMKTEKIYMELLEKKCFNQRQYFNSHG